MTTIKSIPNAAAPPLAACLGAAQREAERLFGDGPVRAWRPRFDWRPWVVGAALVAVAAAVALLWPWVSRPLPDSAPVATASHVGALALAPAATQVLPGEGAAGAAAANVVPRCDEARCAARGVAGEALEPALAEAPALASGEALIAAAKPAATSVLPENLEAWALDPQPLGTANTAAAVAAPLVNTPVIPDEFDPTPADESAPADEPVEPPAE